MRISDWSSDVCSSDLLNLNAAKLEEIRNNNLFSPRVAALGLAPTPENPGGLSPSDLAATIARLRQEANDTQSKIDGIQLRITANQLERDRAKRAAALQSQTVQPAAEFPSSTTPANAATMGNGKS